MTTAHLLHPTVLTFRRINDRHDLRPRVVAVANENTDPRLSSAVGRRGVTDSRILSADLSSKSLPSGAARAPAAEPIGLPDGPGVACCCHAAPASDPVQSSFHSTGDNRA